MKISHSKLKDKILQIIAKHSMLISESQGNALEGAYDLFDYLKKQINEEIYIFYIEKCEADFFSKYTFEALEPYVKGVMESRYFIIRMFNISFAEYFDFITDLNSDNQDHIKPDDNEKKISA